jgi:drug/metabolite transporter (DMT)-like permease
MAWRPLPICLCIPFSLAYVKLDAGVGALILFGSVQLTMFGLGWRNGEKLQAGVVPGMLLAFAGLIALLAPGGNAPPYTSASLMAVAGIAWGNYSVLGKPSANPARDTAGNFLRSLPFMAIVAARSGC